MVAIILTAIFRLTVDMKVILLIVLVDVQVQAVLRQALLGYLINNLQTELWSHSELAKVKDDVH